MSYFVYVMDEAKHGEVTERQTLEGGQRCSRTRSKRSHQQDYSRAERDRLIN